MANDNSDTDIDRTIFGMFTAAEQAYAISQLDPFHDTPYRLAGAPSDQQSDSVVLTINQEAVVSAADFGLPTTSGDKWDMHVAMLPILNQQSCYRARQVSPGHLSAPGTLAEDDVIQLYPLSFHGVAVGDPTFCDNNSTILGIGSTIPVFQSSTGLAVQSGRNIRVIGASFEVVDESPNLYMQGAVTVYERPSSPNYGYMVETAVLSGGIVPADIPFPGPYVSGPPNRLSTATILPDSKTWKAKDGAYVIARQCNENLFHRPGIADVTIFNPPDPTNPNLDNCYMPREALNVVANPGTAGNSDALNMVIPYNVSGAYFSGLNSEFGTYRIRSKLIYEVIPDPSDTSLITQATPTLPKNPTFEKLLYDVLSKQATGVPQTWNPRGEAWRKVLRGISDASMAISAGFSVLPGGEVVSAPLALTGAAFKAASKAGKKKKGKASGTKKPTK